jgi:nucleotide-binding universal stress UspA family protein
MSPALVEQNLVQQEELTSKIIDELLDRVERLTGRDAGQVSVVIEDGAPAETIIAQSDVIGADLIVIGAVGRTGDHRRHLGSVAAGVVERAHLSVLVARPGGETGRILLATDFSNPAEPAARLAAAEAVNRCGSITVVHSVELMDGALAMGEPAAIPPITLAAYPVEEMRQVAHDRLAETLVHLGVAGEIEVTEGPPSDAIVEVAGRTHADLVVIGTHSHSGIDRLLLGSVALRVVREAPCSVLVARPLMPPRRPTAPGYATAAPSP